MRQLGQHNQLVRLEPRAILDAQLRQIGQVCVDLVEERTGHGHDVTVAQHQAGQARREVAYRVLEEEEEEKLFCDLCLVYSVCVFMDAYRLHVDVRRLNAHVQ